MSNTRTTQTQSYFVGVTASADGSQLREETFNNVSYIVVPIVSAVGDRVWWPINSPSPVLILASVLETHAQTRNYRPVVMGHPIVSGDYVSANSPQVLEEWSFGFMFNSVFDDGKIKVEAWLDPERAKIVGAAAENVISRLKNGENVEVSEGNDVLYVREEGEFNGQKYGIRWVSVANDHLAMLDVGEKGACDNKMGCGRVMASGANNGTFASRDLNISILTNDLAISGAKSMSKDKAKDKAKQKQSIFGRMMASIRNAMSNNALRWKLYGALCEIEPGVQYVDDEDVAAGTVRYVVVLSYGYEWDSDSEREYHTYQRTFTIDAQDNVTINNDRVELVYDETKAWVVKPNGDGAVGDGPEEQPATSDMPMASTEKPCECQKSTNANKGGNEIMTPTVAQKNFASKLISASASPFEESDRGMLEAMPEPKLQALSEKFEEKTEEPAPVPAPVVAASDPNSVTLTREEYQMMRAASDAHAATIAARKSHLVSSLAAAQTGLTESDLNEMSLPTLDKLAISFKIDQPSVADYSLRGVPESRTTVASAARPLPDTWGLNKAN